MYAYNSSYLYIHSSFKYFSQFDILENVYGFVENSYIMSILVLKNTEKISKASYIIINKS